MSENAGEAMTGPGGYTPDDFQLGDPEMVGFAHGQKDYVLVARGPGEIEAGRVSFNEYDGSWRLNYIEVAPEFRRCRVGTMLVLRLTALAKLQTGRPLEWSSTTQEGTALRERIARMDATVDKLAPADQVRVTLWGGKTFEGEVHGGPFPYVESHDKHFFFILSANEACSYAKVSEIVVTRLAHEVLAERAKRKFGVWAYPDPETRDGYERVLYWLAHEINQLQADLFKGGFNAQSSRRARELEAQFHAIADRIELAKTKRTYILCFNAGRRACGMPDVRRTEFNPMRNSYDVPAASVPKPTDFDPSPEVRAQRAPRLPEDYPDRAEIEWCLKDAEQRADKRSSSRERREHFTELAAKHRVTLAAGDYYEAKAEEYNMMMRVPDMIDIPAEAVPVLTHGGASR
jgi:hypothetical protein